LKDYLSNNKTVSVTLKENSHHNEVLFTEWESYGEAARPSRNLPFDRKRESMIRNF